MSLVRFNPFTPARTSNWFDDFFNGDIANVFGQDISASVPEVNVKEHEDNFEIDVAAPGLEKNDFNVTVDNNVLTISAEKEGENKEEKDKYTRREFNYTSFKRSFTLPESVKADEIKGKYEDGVLKINIPKKEEAREKPAKEIKID